LQTTEDKAVTTTGESSGNSENQNLVSGLFFALENDPDLKLIIEKWSELSVELRRAIVKMID